MQGIVIQGPTDHYKEVADNWSGWPNVVWSTWKDEPQENIDYIRSKNIDVILNNKPEIPGDININYQAKSTYSGLVFLQNKGVTEALKIRGDHYVSDIKSLLEILQGRKMAFMVTTNPAMRGDYYYYLEGHHLAHDYPSDNLVYGKIEDMVKMWDFEMGNKYGIPPESLIVWHYLTKLGIKFDLDFKYLQQQGISFFLRECLNKNVNIHWIKKDQSLITLYNNEYYLF